MTLTAAVYQLAFKKTVIGSHGYQKQRQEAARKVILETYEFINVKVSEITEFRK